MKKEGSDRARAGGTLYSKGVGGRLHHVVPACGFKPASFTVTVLSFLPSFFINMPLAYRLKRPANHLLGCGH